jgi:starvation-inducible DNA-binding protein
VSKSEFSNVTKLNTPNDLGEEAKKAISEQINPLIADVFAIYIKTKNFHWHVSGSHYRDYHLLFDEHAAQIFVMVDALAERVRKLGGTTIRSMGHLCKLQKIADDDESFVPAKEMICRLMNDNKKLANSLRAAHKVCSNYEDVATTSILETFIDETERRIWFLYETQAD